MEPKRAFLSRTGWALLAGVTAVFGVILPLLRQVVPETSALYPTDYAITLMGKFGCYAMAAMAMDLIWGYAGILSLGHGVFFALGGYALGMNLMLAIAGEGVYRSQLPDFMVFLDWKELPWFWRGFESFFFAALMALLVPGALAYVFGWFAFRSRIRGVYLSIITQALTFALMLLFFRNETGLGGNNGLTDFKRIYGYSLQASSTKLGLYLTTVIGAVGVFLLCRYLVKSRFGQVLRAIRDAEDKTRFSGYDTLSYKLFAWTASAMICGLAGALYVPQVGIINPSELEPANSIEMAIWVACGGRGTIAGAAVGAVLVNGAKSALTGWMPEFWLFALGALFIGVTLFIPRGVVGVLQRKRASS